MMKHTALLQFAKAPLLGGVKTRMQPYLSQQQSVDLHTALMMHCAYVCQQAHELHWDWQLCVGSHPAHESFTALTTNIYQQQGNDLGEKLHDAVMQSFQTHDHVVVVGSDCPFFSLAYFQQVDNALQQYDVVIGPANDGGYVMIALNRMTKESCKAIFDSIDWGTGKVLQQTRDKIKAQSLSCCELAPLSDIDRPEDLRLLADLNIEAFKSFYA